MTTNSETAEHDEVIDVSCGTQQLLLTCKNGEFDPPLTECPGLLLLLTECPGLLILLTECPGLLLLFTECPDVVVLY